MQAVIERVQLTFSLTNIIDLCVSSNILYIAIGSTTIIRIDLDDPSRVHDVQIKQKNQTIKRLMVDNSGTHLIVETTSLQYFYLYAASPALRPLKLGHHINQIAWHRESAYFTCDSTIYRLELGSLKNDKRKEHVAKIWTKEPLHGIAVMHETLWAMTSSALYKSNIDPYNFNKVSELHGKSRLLASNDLVAVQSEHEIILMDEKGTSRSLREDSEQIMLSKYHVLALKNQTLDIYNSTTLKLVQSLETPAISGADADSQYQTYWAFNASAVYEIKLENESKGMWQIYLQENQYQNALDIASSHDKLLIYKEYGDYEFEHKNFDRAAEYYGFSDAHLEGLALKFIQLDNKPALVELFKARLAHTVNPVQQTIITSWIAELLLQIGGATEFKEFVTNCKAQVSRKTLLSMLQNHAATHLLVWFAEFTEDFRFVVSHYIENSQWESALKILREREDEDLLYRYSTVLMAHCPQATVESWMRIPKLDPLRLLPALLSYSSSYRGDYKGHQAIRYLRYQLQGGSGSGGSGRPTAPTALYNALLMIYAQTDNEVDLLEFLTAKASKFPDYNFGLRVCLENNKIQCAIYLYTVMSLYEEAVHLCLGQDRVDQAIEIVEQHVDNEQMRRALWLEISQKIIASSGTTNALKLTDHLNVEDILELFPDFDTLDHMVPEVVKALEASSNSLVAVHQEMQDSIRASKGMQQEMKSFKKQYALVEPGEPCQQCRFPLATRKFYVFPCQHGFHFDCIIKELETTKQGAKIRELRAQVKDPKDLNDALDPLARSECLLCSESRIEKTDVAIESEW